MSDPTAFVVSDVEIFDGQRTLGRGFVVVEDGRIAAVGTGRPPETDLPMHDGRGATLMPGLIDGHTHSERGSLEAALLFGVTTEMDMGSDPVWMQPQRALAAQRDDVADVRSASFGATAPGGHPGRLIGTQLFPTGFPTVAGPEQAEEFVDGRIAEGADYLKIYIEDGQALNRPNVPPLSAESAGALVRAAHERGLAAYAHATSLHGAQIALDAGVDALVHLFMDTPAPPGIVERIAEAGIFVVPTLVTLGSLAGDRDGAGMATDPRVAPLLSDAWRANLCRCWPAHDCGSLEAASSTVAALAAAGVTLLAGTDAASIEVRGIAHGVSVHDELGMLVDAGLSPVDALSAATGAAAAAFGLTDRGRIAPGLRADMVLVEGDPTRDVGATLSICEVWRRGVRLDRAALGSGRGDAA